ncbi:MAG: DUF2271 domain-containing protein [Lautropia sp.]|nr:DUF2271 domain-containing protein [Lautropia sp.]
MKTLRPSLLLATLLAATPAIGAGLDVDVEIPRINASDYQRPYVAVWVEAGDRTVPGTLAVWYQQDAAREGGERGSKWLKDMRQWWRRAGRDLNLPIDGVSGATRPAGRHTISVTIGGTQLPKLADGQYKLMVEAAREHGGRELVSLPFQWPPADGQQPITAQGSSELGAISLTLKP